MKAINYKLSAIREGKLRRRVRDEHWPGCWSFGRVCAGGACWIAEQKEGRRAKGSEMQQLSSLFFNYFSVFLLLKIKPCALVVGACDIYCFKNFRLTPSRPRRGSDYILSSWSSSLLISTCLKIKNKHLDLLWFLPKRLSCLFIPA